MCNVNQVNMESGISHYYILKNKSFLVQGDTDIIKEFKNYSGKQFYFPSCINLANCRKQNKGQWVKGMSLRKGQVTEL